MRGYLKTLNWIFKLKPRTTTVGRDKDSDLCLQNGGVDEHHATIEWNETEHCYVLSDLNSIHGTYVNDCRIHNAAVRLTTGDELHFGYGGSAYKLFMDLADPLPVLRSQSSASSSSSKLRSHVWSSPVTPHPPCRPRPASAGARCTDVNPKNLKSMSQTHRKVGRWANSTGKGIIFGNVSMPLSSYSMQDLLQEEGCVRCKQEPSDELESQDETQRTECVIRALRDEVSTLQLQLTQNSQSDPNIKHKLSNLAHDIQEKKEEIQQLKEQILAMQTRSGELTVQVVAERDQQINRLKEQLDNLKTEKSKSAALLNSLQKDLLAREKQVLKLAAEVDKLRQDLKYKDAQLSNMTNKLTKMKKHQEEFLAKEKTVESLKKSVEQFEVSMREKQKELQQQNTERDLLKHKLEQMTQEQNSLQAEMDKLKLLQQHTLQREQKAQSELKHTQTRLENIYSHIIKHVLLISETVSEQEMLEKLSVVAKQNQLFRSRVQELEENLRECNKFQKMVEGGTEKFKTKLLEFQHNMQNLCLMDAMQSQIYALQEESVFQTVSWVQTHALTILSSLYTLIQDSANNLFSTGIEVSEKTGGVSGAVKTLCQQHQTIQSEVRILKEQQRDQLEVREAQTVDLKTKLESMRQELELQKLQASERLLKIENTVKLQLEKMKADLESATEVEAALRLEMKVQEVNWRTKLEKAEEERESTKVEIEEYREQVRQHAYTIVAMEKQIILAQQREQEMQVQRDSLIGQLKETLSNLEDKEPNVSSDQSKEEQLNETVTSLRASLEVSQEDVAKQGQVIASLSLDLAHANARLSDLTGELSEKQKIELETHKSLLIAQKMQLSMLHQKLSITSQLLEQKDEELKTLKEKLMGAEGDLRSIFESENRKKDESHVQDYTQRTKDVAVMVSPSNLIAQGLKSKDRHVEIIHQQKQDLNIVKERIRALEQKTCMVSGRGSQQREPATRGQMKPAQIKTRKLQRSAVQKGFISSVVQSGFAFPEALSEAALERTARLDLSDALELSEKTYVDLSRALCEALMLSEEQLSGCVSLKHLPSGEREHMASLRQDDLELLRSCLALLNSQSQKKDLLLQDSQREIQTLRESQAVKQQLQIELDRVCSELGTLKQESDKLHQALQDARSQLQHYPKHKNHKVAVGKRSKQQENRKRK